MKGMLSCEEATRLMSEGRDRVLRVRERASLAVHTAICAGCRHFERQLGLLGEFMQRFARGDHPAAEAPPRDSE